MSGKKTARKSVVSSKKKKGKNQHNTGQKKSAELWIAPKPSSSNNAAIRKWSEEPASSAGSRLLDFADIALGLKKPDNFRKRRSGALKPKP